MAGGAGIRAAHRRPGAARADLPPAGRAAEVAGRVPARAPGRAVRAVGADRGDAVRLQVRRRRRHRRAAQLREQGPAGAAERHRLHRGRRPSRWAGAASSSASTSSPRCAGVAVQINAFNFPVWGPLEKFAPAFLAGVPSLVKPASQTAYLTARLVELIVESGLLPEGSLQLVCGSVGRPARPPRPSRTWCVHRLGLDRPAAARAPDGGRPLGPVQRRGRLAELLHPRPGRGAGHAPSSTCTSSSWSPR